MEWIGNVVSFAGGILAAALAAFVAFKTSKSKMNGDIQARWDAALLERSREFTEATRRVRHHAERYQRSKDKDLRREKIDEAHETMRALAEQLRLVGNRRVQIAARVVLHHAYAVRVEGEEGRDPRKDRFPERPPVSRLNDALQEFYRAVRAQLKAPSPEDVVHSDDLYKIVEGVEPLNRSQRSSSA